MKRLFFILCSFIFLFLSDCQKFDEGEELVNSDNNLYQFVIPGQESSEIDLSANKVSVRMPAETDLTTLAPSIITAGVSATTDPKSGYAFDFSIPVYYSVIAQNGQKRIYEVTAYYEKRNETKIRSFSVDKINGIITEADRSIEITLPYGTDLRILKPEFIISDGATITPGNEVINDFTNPVDYTVVSEDQKLSATYRVTVKLGKSTDNKILIFSIPGSISTDIDNEKNIIKIVMPENTKRDALIPSISISDKAIINITSGVPTNFNRTVYAEIQSENGEKRRYSIIVKNSTDCVDEEKNISAFKISRMGEKHYEMIRENKTWIQAALCAKAMGGKLIEVNEFNEYSALPVQVRVSFILDSAKIGRATDGGTYTYTRKVGDENIVETKNVPYAWVGGTDEASEGIWKWNGTNAISSELISFFEGNDEDGSNIAGWVNTWQNIKNSYIDKMAPDNGRRLATPNEQDFMALGFKDYDNIFGQGFNDLKGNNKLYYIIEYD